MELLDQELESQFSMALATAHYENEYDKVFGRTLQLLDAELARMRRTEQFLLQIENENLQSQLNQANQELIQALSAESNARCELKKTGEEIARLQTSVLASSREIESLRREIALSSDAVVESKKLLSEKIHLSKEISNIQTEVERLRSQNSSSHALLAEKQDLTRQLSTLEVQLEHEKRAHERTIAKGTKQMEEMELLSSKLEEACRELELARQHNQVPEQLNSRERKQKQVVSNRQNGNLNTKIVPLKDQSQGTPDHLPKQHAAATKPGNHPEKPGVAPLPNPAARINPELTIATPGAVRSRVHQQRASALPGDKSSFSITPFLNRTTGLQDSAISSDDELDELQADVGTIRLGQMSTHREHGEKKMTNIQRPLPPRSQKLGNQDTGKTPSVSNGKVSKLSAHLDSGDEAGNTSIGNSRASSHIHVPFRKRKLGIQRDRSLFDDDDHDDEDNGSRDIRRPGRKLVGSGQHKPQLPGSRHLEFSPLKRDRKRL